MEDPLPERLSTCSHPWHGLHPGENTPEIIRGFIEIPKGSRAKYEVDKASGLLKLDRVLQSSVHYPIHYGFIPQSLCGDGDPLDILVLCSVDLTPGCVIEARVIGRMKMEDKGEQDDKILAVAVNDESVNYIHDIHQLPPHAEKEISQFFKEYKLLEKREVNVHPFEGKDAAYAVIRQCLTAYQQVYNT